MCNLGATGATEQLVIRATYFVTTINWWEQPIQLQQVLQLCVAQLSATDTISGILQYFTLGPIYLGGKWNMHGCGNARERSTAGLLLRFR
jgi:hypothetical protein